MNILINYHYTIVIMPTRALLYICGPTVVILIWLLAINSGPALISASELNEFKGVYESYSSPSGFSADRPIGWTVVPDSNQNSVAFFPPKQNSTNEIYGITFIQRPASFSGEDQNATDMFLRIASTEYRNFTLQNAYAATDTTPTKLVYTYDDPRFGGPVKILQGIVPAADGPWWLLYATRPASFTAYLETASDVLDSFKIQNQTG